MTAAAFTSPRRLLVGILVISLSLLSSALPVSPVRAVTAVFINEIHYDNASTDVGEAIEVAGPAGTDLTGWSLVRYNGANGLVYVTPAGPVIGGIIPDQQAGYGTLSFSYPENGLQNGAPDGIALVDNNNTVIQFLSYEGTFTAADGPAAGMLSTSIGVSETGSEAVGQSLQLTGAGTTYEGFTWAAPAAATFGAINSGQTFSLISPVVATCGGTLSAAEGYPATRTVTARDNDGVVTDLSIVGVAPSDPGTITIGATTPASGVGGTASALVTVGATTPLGTYSVQIRGTNSDVTPQTGDCFLSVTVAAVLPIGTVQGAVSDAQDGLLHRSPFAPASGNGAGTTDVFVRGVVTQKFLLRTSSGGNSFGLFLQNTLTTDDDDAQTSDGVFGFMGSFADILALYGGPSYVPVVGDEVVFRARVTEFFFLTELSSMRFVSLVRSGVDLDAETPAVLADPPADLGDANRFWERGEGMRFRVEAGSVVTAPRDVFGSTLDAEFWVIAPDNDLLDRADPFARRIFRDPHPLDDIDSGTLFDNGNGARTMIQSHGLKAAAADNTVVIAPARVNDVIDADVIGALYFAFGKYGVEAGAQPSLTPGADPSLNAPPSPAVTGEEFSTSDYNVENLYDFRDDPFDGCDFAGNAGCPGVNPPFDYVPASLADYQLHLDDLAAQIVNSLHSPDLMMIQEAEDQDICVISAGVLVCGGVNNADGKADTLQELALTILDMGGPEYDVAYDRNGADDRGIVSAFLFRVDSVELLPADASDPVLGSAPSIVYPGAPLAYNADVSNPKALNADLPAGTDTSTGTDGGDVYTRAPQVGHFRIWRDGIGESVFTELWAISNHFSSTPNARVGQRTEQAAYQVAIADAILGADPAARFISGGDFNVFPRPDDPFTPGQAYGCCSFGPSDQLGDMYDAGLHNLWDTLVADVPASAYSFSFQGQAQTLDMQWANDGQFADLVQVRAGHFNADFPAKYAGDVARAASDHDPQVARWNTDVTIVRLHALLDYFVATGDLSASKAGLLHATLNRAQRFLDRGMTGAYLSQLAAFGDQAQDLAPVHVSHDAADALEAEADRLASS